MSAKDRLIVAAVWLLAACFAIASSVWSWRRFTDTPETPVVGRVAVTEITCSNSCTQAQHDLVEEHCGQEGVIAVRVTAIWVDGARLTREFACIGGDR